MSRTLINNGSMKQTSVLTISDGTRLVESRSTGDNLWKPTFKLTREEIYDAPSDPRVSNVRRTPIRSHQTSTFIDSEDSPQILVMPTKLPFCVMPRVDGIEGAHLVRRNMEYVETCEYLLSAATTTSNETTRVNVRNSALASSTSARQRVQIREEDNESVSTSRSSTRSRRSSVLNTPTSDRILRPRPGRKNAFSEMSRISEQHNTNSLAEKDDNDDEYSMNSYQKRWLVPNLYGIGSGVTEAPIDYNNNNSSTTRNRREGLPKSSSEYTSTTRVSSASSHLSLFKRLAIGVYTFLALLVAGFLVLGHFIGVFCTSIWSWIRGIFSTNTSSGSPTYHRGSLTIPAKSKVCTNKRCCLLFLLPLLLLLLLLALFLLRPLDEKHTSFLEGYLPLDADCFPEDPLRLVKEPASQLAILRWHCLTMRAHNITYPLYLSFMSRFTPSSSKTVSLPPIGDAQTVETLRTQLTLHHTAMKNALNDISNRVHDAHERIETITNSVTALTTEQQHMKALHQKAGLTDSHLEESFADLRLQLATLEQEVNSKTGVSAQQAIIDTLVKQALFVSTTSLEKILDKFKDELATSESSPNAVEFEQFARRLDELRALINTHRSDLDDKLQQANREFDAHRRRIETMLASSTFASGSLEERNELLKQVETIAKSNLERLSSQMDALSSRLASMEQLNANLEATFKEHSLQLSKDAEKRFELFETSQASKISALLETFKNTFSGELSSSLQQKITEELKSKTSHSDLQLVIISLIKSTIDEKLKEVFKDLPASLGSDAMVQVRGYVEAGLDRFMADRTGLADFALRSAGGSVVSTRCTKTFSDGALGISLFGYHLKFFSDSQQRILEPSVHPGECWCFHGSEGQAIVKLAVPTHVTGVTLEHIPKALTFTGKIDSAPRDFAIKALDSDVAEDGPILGSFTYDQDGAPIQFFPIVVTTANPVSFVELAISSNHGHPEYTCVYRFRVHGTVTEDN